MKLFTMKQLGIIIALTLGVILAFSPVGNKTTEQINFEKLAADINSRHDHVTAEQVGQLLIDKDPDLQLIDLRDPAEYQKFHIQTAINLPLNNLFTEGQLAYIDPQKLVVLYSNGGTHAAQAWVMLQQMGYNNTTVLLGGLNYWVDVYTNSSPPEGVYADPEIFNYQFKVSAGNYLMGNVKTEGNTQDAGPPVKMELPKRRKKSKSADEGC